MRALLLLAIFGTLAVVIALVIARRIVGYQVKARNARLNREHVRELEKENAELDDLNEKIAARASSFYRGGKR